MKLSILFIGVLILVVLPQSIVSLNWIKFFRTMLFVRSQMRAQKPIGLVNNLPQTFNVDPENIQIFPNPRQLINPRTNGAKEADPVFGKGMALYSHQAQVFAHYNNRKKPQNVCGLVLTSLTDFNSAFVDRMRIFWRSGNVPWDLVVNPKDGSDVFYPRFRPGKNTRVILFDSIPAVSFQFLFIGQPGKNLDVKLTFITDCKYKGIIEITKCGETIDRNPRFALLPSGSPITIKCPIDCIRTWPCWGFKVYSTDSPICWAATQNFGRYGNGIYTLYKIPKVAFFRSEINPSLTHGIYCRRSTTHYSGFTFDRKYFDSTKKEYRDYMGA